MARKVFFSFHFQKDSWRVAQVRNSNAFKSKIERIEKIEKSTFLDRAAWEEVERRGKKAIKDWIDSNIKGTSVTVVLIGAETNSREWVHYEIEKSWNDGNGLLGIKIHNIKDQNRNVDEEGENPFRYYYFDEEQNLTRRAKGENEYGLGLGVFPPNGLTLLSKYIKTYDWNENNGRENIGEWIEEAAKQAGR